MFRQSRTWLGLFLALLGIVVSRGTSIVTVPSEWANPLYLLGIAVALGGLALFASTMQVSYVSAVACPHCFLVNSADAEKCVRCATPLNVDDGDVEAIA